MNNTSLFRTFLNSNKKYLQEMFEDNRRLCFGAPAHFMLRAILVPRAYDTLGSGWIKDRGGSGDENGSDHP